VCFKKKKKNQVNKQMVNAVINSHQSILNLLGSLRATIEADSNNKFELRSISIDSNASKLSSNLNAWGPLLSALTLPAASINLRTLDVCNIHPDIGQLVVPHLAKLAQHLPNLQKFALRRCPIGSKTAEFVGDCLHGHPSLKTIIVEQCDLRSEGASIFVSNLLRIKDAYGELSPMESREPTFAAANNNNNNHQTNSDHHTLGKKNSFLQSYSSGSGSSSSSSPLEYIDIGHNEIRMTACSEIANLVRICVSQYPYYANLNRIEFRGNNFVLTEEEKNDALLKKLVSKERGVVSDQQQQQYHHKLPELPSGENLHFMTSAEKDRGFVFPTLDYMSNQVREDLTPTPK
jgi:hypothetical protein